MTQNSDDLVILVNEADQEIGVMDKYEAHRNPAQLHRAISVYLFNKNGELLLQQRSEQKIVGALQWANTCCGNVRPGETYKDCAYRRLKEELGITEVTISPVHKFTYQCVCNEIYSEHEIDQIFVGLYDGEVRPVTKEVADYTWVDWNGGKIGEWKDGQKLDYAPWFEIMIKNDEIVAKIKKS